jgi:hypothetical protein
VQIQLPPGPPTVDDVVVLKAVTGGPVGTLTWSLPGGNPNRATTADVRVRYATAGPKQIAVSVTSGGATATATATVEILPRGASRLDRLRSAPAVGSGVLDLGTPVRFGYDYVVGTSRGARVRLQALSGGQPAPGSAAVTSAAYAQGSGSGEVTFTVADTGRSLVAVQAVRVELVMDDGSGTVLTSQTVPFAFVFAPPVPQPEDCRPYDPAQLSLVPEGDLWLLAAPNERIKVFASRADGQLALDLARTFTADCYIGRDTTRADRDRYVTHYWQGPGSALRPDEDCLPYDPQQLVIRDLGAAGWRLETAAGEAMFLADNRADAERLLAVYARHTRYCYIGRGNNRADRERYIFEYAR